MQNLLKSCNLNFFTCFKVCRIRGFEVLTTRRNVLFFGLEGRGGSSGLVIDCVIEFNALSAQKYY